MAARLIGDLNAFWANVAGVGAGANSAVVELGRGVSNFMVWATSSGATELAVQVGPRADLVGGIEGDDVPATWFDLLYLESSAAETQKIVFAAAGSRSLIIPDIAFAFVRLQNLTAGVTLTAGWSGIQD